MKEAICELIGRHVANRRINAEYTQEYVSAKVGISRQALSMIERGVNPPRWETLYVLAEVLHCEVCDLLPTRGAARRLYERAQESL